MLGGPKGEAVALRVAKGILVPPSTRGQGLVDRALPTKTQEAPQLLTRPRSCGLRAAIRGVHAHTHTHSLTHMHTLPPTRLAILSTSQKAGTGVGSSLTSTTHQLEPPLFSSGCRLAPFSRGCSPAELVIPRADLSSRPSRVPPSWWP